MARRGVADLPRLTCSFGVASFPTHGDSVASLFIAADSALYRAKALGRNRVEWAAQPASSPP
jgi:diguanylate cyclase (GGDEF)-like protein